MLRPRQSSAAATSFWCDESLADSPTTLEAIMEASPWYSLTPHQRINEPGTEPACPFCLNPRVVRSCYVRCNHCGINWLDEEMGLPNYLNMDPRVARKVAALTGTATKHTAEQKAADVDDFTLPKLN